MSFLTPNYLSLVTCPWSLVSNCYHLLQVNYICTLPLFELKLAMFCQKYSEAGDQMPVASHPATSWISLPREAFPGKPSPENKYGKFQICGYMPAVARKSDSGCIFEPRIWALVSLLSSALFLPSQPPMNIDNIKFSISERHTQ
jgi:hypothetical protein